MPAKNEASVGRLNFTPERPISEHTVNFLVQSDVRLNGPLNVRERPRSDCAETDKVNKARPISKRERDALKLCFEARGTPIALSTHWPRTALWLVLHGFIQATGHDQRGNRIYRITPEGEAAWLAIAGGAAKD